LCAVFRRPGAGGADVLTVGRRQLAWGTTPGDAGAVRKKQKSRSEKPGGPVISRTARGDPGLRGWGMFFFHVGARGTGGRPKGGNPFDIRSKADSTQRGISSLGAGGHRGGLHSFQSGPVGTGGGKMGFTGPNCVFSKPPLFEGRDVFRDFWGGPMLKTGADVHRAIFAAGGGKVSACSPQGFSATSELRKTGGGGGGVPNGRCFFRGQREPALFHQGGLPAAEGTGPRPPVFKNPADPQRHVGGGSGGERFLLDSGRGFLTPKLAGGGRGRASPRRVNSIYTGGAPGGTERTKDVSARGWTRSHGGQGGTSGTPRFERGRFFPRTSGPGGRIRQNRRFQDSFDAQFRKKNPGLGRGGSGALSGRGSTFRRFRGGPIGPPGLTGKTGAPKWERGGKPMPGPPISVSKGHGRNEGGCVFYRKTGEPAGTGRSGYGAVASSFPRPGRPAKPGFFPKDAAGFRIRTASGEN